MKKVMKEMLSENENFSSSRILLFAWTIFSAIIGGYKIVTGTLIDNDILFLLGGMSILGTGKVLQKPFERKRNSYQQYNSSRNDVGGYDDYKD